MRVRYLNIGDPVAFGFTHPRTSCGRASTERCRMAHNGYWTVRRDSAGAGSGGCRVHRTGFPVSADRVFITAGTSEGIELTLSAVVDGGGEVLVPMPTYPLYTAVLAKLDARATYYRLDAVARMDAGPRSPAQSGDASDAGAGGHRPEQPDGRRLPNRRRAVRCSTSPTRTACSSWPMRCTAIWGSTARSSHTVTLDPDAADHLVLEPLEGLSRARLAHRLDGDRPLAAVGRRRGGGEEAGRRTPLQHGADAIRGHRAALHGDRSHQRGVPRTRCGAARDADGRSAVRDARRQLRRANRGVLRDAAASRSRRARTDEDYVVVAPPRHRGALRLRLRIRSARRKRASSASSSSRRSMSSPESTICMSSIHGTNT